MSGRARGAAFISSVRQRDYCTYSRRYEATVVFACLRARAAAPFAFCSVLPLSGFPQNSNGSHAHSSALGSDLEATVCVPFFPGQTATMNYDDDEHDDDECFADTQEVSFLVVSGKSSTSCAFFE